MTILAFLIVCLHPALAQTPAELADAHPGLHVLIAGDVQLAADLARPAGSIVHCLCGDEATAGKLRAAVGQRGLRRVTVECSPGPRLPFADNVVNLLVAADGGAVPKAEVMRVLCPKGVARVGRDTWVKPWPKSIDEWTHYLHDATGNALARDAVVDEPYRMQWAAGPKWARHHNSIQGLSAWVSAAGRMFAILDEAPPGQGADAPDDWALVARDAFNGLPLWRKPIRQWGWRTWSDHGRCRFNQPTHVTRRLVAAGDRVYVTLGFNAPLTALDARTGKLVRTYENTANTSEIYHVDGLLVLSVNNAPQKPGDRATEGPPPVTKRIQVMRADGGKLLWKKGDYVGLRSKTHSSARVSHLTPAIDGGRIVFVDGHELVCLALADGKELWRTKRPAFKEVKMRYEIRITDMCTLVAHGGKVYFAQIEPDRGIDWRRTRATFHTFDAATGKRLWGRTVAEWGWGHPTDIFCHSGLVWVHDYEKYLLLGVDPDTGEIKRQCSNEKAFDNGHHHRCYRNKATERFLLTGYRGTELIDWSKGTVSLNHWARGSCRIGVMPCNGLLYTAPHPCDCYIQSKLNGFVALAPKAKSKAPSPKTERPVKGPAFSEISNLKSQISKGDWPTYRHDPQRTGIASCDVPPGLKRLWQADLNGRPSACTVAAGSVYVACLDDHHVYALGAGDGKVRWSAAAGGNVDTPPTAHGPLVLFGSADGVVHCVRAADGRAVWRFRAAPAERRIVTYGRLESAWPVHGSVLVADGAACVVAGRSSFLDGGLHAYRLDPATGSLLARRTVCTPHDMPVDGGRDQAAFTGAKADILVAAPEGVYMGQMLLFAKKGVQPPALSFHVRTTAGFLDESWFNRTNFFLGRQPCGDYLIADADRAYGVRAFSKMEPNMAFFTPGGKGYELYCGDVANRPKPAAPKKPRKSRKPLTVKPTGRPSPGPGTRFAGPSPRIWQVHVPIRVTAMTRAGTTLFAAGTPDVLDKADPYAPYRGARGGLLRAIDADSGRTLAEYQLPAAPVYDGLAAAGGKLYIATIDGKVTCFAGK